MNEKILVSTANGNIGSEIAKRLKEEKIPFKAADIKDVKDKLGDDVEFVFLDFEDVNTYSDAFKEVNKFFLNRPPQMTEFENSIFPVIKTAKKAGVEHIVFLSMIGVNKRIPHYKIEQYLIKSGIKYTFLRASFFMQNLTTIHREVISKERDLLIPAGKGKISFIDIRDIAAVAVKVLTETSDIYINKVINLTGSEALDFYAISEIMTKILGKNITYSNPKSKIFIKKMISYGFPKDFVKVMKWIYFIVRIGKADMLYPDTEKILGRKPIKMKAFIKDYADCWLE